MKRKINEVAKLTGVTVRALHYYDSIGLLSPDETTDAGYRLYGDAELTRLQEILFLRELDFPLKQIAEILQSPRYDRSEALRRQRALLVEKRAHLSDLIALIERVEKGEAAMDFNAFDNQRIDDLKRQYAEEARERWGNTDAYRESAKKVGARSAAEQKAVEEEQQAILAAFADIRTLSPKSEEAQALVRRQQAIITANYYRCTDEILAGLGQMYVADERFRKNIDRFGEGTAAFLSEAIAAYCAK